MLAENLLLRTGSLVRRALVAHWRPSYSQCGEDMLLRFVFTALGVPRPSYLDIGAHHPTALSNTHVFYLTGSRGVNVEPDPSLFDRFTKARRKDVNLRVAVGPARGKLAFYIFSERAISTCSEVTMRDYTERLGHTLLETIEVPVVTFDDLCEQHFGGKAPDLVSLDVEGLDLDVLRSVDFKRYRPLVLCVETAVMGRSLIDSTRDDRFDAVMSAVGYIKYADTHINTIYLDETAAKTRLGLESR